MQMVKNGKDLKGVHMYTGHNLTSNLSILVVST